MQRSAGILLPISSLPSPYGIGCFSQEAYDFVDWLKEAGQTYWQILPLGVTSYGDSPYQSFSAFAGNPYFISLDALVEEGVLTAAECKKANFGRKADDINYSRLYTERGRLLRLAYSRSDIGHNEAFAAFCEKNKWCASTTSVGSMRISPSPTAARLRWRATGRKAPALSCSVPWSRRWASGRSLQRILAT